MTYKLKRIFTEKERKNQNDPKYNSRKKMYRLRKKEHRRMVRQKYYDKFKIVIEKTKDRPTGVPHRPWEDHELNIINQRGIRSLLGTIYLMPDSQLSFILHRSVRAIQMMRHRLKKEMK